MMTEVVVETAKAKVNLALHVLGRRADGYHELDSIVAFADVADVVTVAAADTDSLSITGRFANDVPAGRDNSVLQAVSALRAKGYEFPPLAFTLEKNLPVAAGLGGGSADAAATLRAIIRFGSLAIPSDQLGAIALKLGADVPVCLLQKTCRMRGIGETIEPIAKVPWPAIVLVNPLQTCATQSVFEALGLAPGDHHGAPPDPDDPATWLNDLAEPAIQVLPAIGTVLGALQKLKSFAAVRMSGSGATCFGLAQSIADAETAAAVLQKRHPGWWIVAARLG